MQITLYKNNSERIVVDKTTYLDGAKNISVVLKENTDVLNPVFLLTFDNPLTELFQYNYVYAESLGYRYYFIDDIVQVTNKLWEIHCSIDVLNTYKTLIKQQTAYISRNQNEYNTLLDDDLVYTEVGARVIYSSGLSDQRPFFDAYNEPTMDDMTYILSVFENIGS